MHFLEHADGRRDGKHNEQNTAGDIDCLLADILGSNSPAQYSDPGRDSVPDNRSSGNSERILCGTQGDGCKHGAVSPLGDEDQSGYLDKGFERRRSFNLTTGLCLWGHTNYDQKERRPITTAESSGLEYSFGSYLVDSFLGIGQLLVSNSCIRLETIPKSADTEEQQQGNSSQLPNRDGTFQGIRYLLGARNKALFIE